MTNGGTVMAGTVLVSLRYPEPGRVKPRLVKSVGPDRAAALYRGWIDTVLEQLQPARNQATILGFCDGAPVTRFAEWSRYVDAWVPQPEGSRAERLEAGFAAAHTQGGPVLVIGVDCLELDAVMVEGALVVLADLDAVFGPASNGGCYLIGTRRHLPGFFEGVRRSRQYVLSDHLARCREQRWTTGMLPERPRIHTLGDWQAYLRRQGRGG